MKGVVLNSELKISVAEVEDPIPSDDEVCISIQTASLNHRDNWIAKGKYPGITPGVVLGSDLCGLIGKREVIVNPSLHWGEDERYQGENFEILGLPSNGAFAEKIVVPKENVFDKPRHLSIRQAATLPLAGLTAFRALFSRAKLTAGERLLITGIGGGVSQMGLAFAKALGVEVEVTSSSLEKIEKADCKGYSYTDEGWSNQAKKQGLYDVILDGAGGDGFEELTQLIKPGGRIVLYGGTAGAWQQVAPQPVFYKQIQILGTTMGSPKDFSSMIEFVSKHSVIPTVDSRYGLDDIVRALDHMDSGKQFGKIVIDV